MNAQLDGTGSLVAVQISSWLAGAAQRISAGNAMGNLDGLFAHHVLADVAGTGLTWDVNPVSAQWLDDNRDRLGHAPVLAALGYGVGCSTAIPRIAGPVLVNGLSRLMGRDHSRTG